MAIRINSEAARSVDGTSLTGTLANVGAVTANPARVVMIFNGCNDAVTVSWDGGTTDGFILPAFSSASVDCSVNDDSDGVKPKLVSGAQFQAKHNGAAPTAGALSITVIY